MIIKDNFSGGSISDYSATPKMFQRGMKYPPSWDEYPFDDYEAEEDDEESEDCDGE